MLGNDGLALRRACFPQILQKEIWNLRIDLFNHLMDALLLTEREFRKSLAVVQLVDDPTGNCSARFTEHWGQDTKDTLEIINQQNGIRMLTDIVPPSYTANESDSDSAFDLSALFDNVVDVLGLIPQEPFRQALMEDPVLYPDPSWSKLAQEEILPLMDFYNRGL